MKNLYLKDLIKILMKISKKFQPSNDWATSTLVFGKKSNFDNKHDFIILPEIWAHFAEDLEFNKKKII